MDNVKQIIETMIQRKGIQIFRRSIKFYRKYYPDVADYIEDYNSKYHSKGTVEAIYCAINGIETPPVCKCGNKCLFRTWELGFSGMCGSCGKRNGIRIAVKNYEKKTGFSNPIKNPVNLQTRKRNNKRKYGYEEVFQVPRIKKLCINTLTQNGGIGFARKTTYDKANITMLDRKGCSLIEYMYTQEWKTKRNMALYKHFNGLSWVSTKEGKETFIQQYYERTLKRLHKFLEEHNCSLVGEYKNCFEPLTVKCTKCGNIFRTDCFNKVQFDTYHLEWRCDQCYPDLSWYHQNNKKTPSECEILASILSTGIDTTVIQNDQKVLGDKKELDIYLPDLNVAIEYCGIWCHSSNQDLCPFHAKDKNCHYYKYAKCKEKGIHLITLFDHIYESDKRTSIDAILAIINHAYRNMIPMPDGTYLLDNRYVSLDTFPDRDDYYLVSKVDPQPWFWINKFFYLSEDEFRLSYCSSDQDTFDVAKELSVNWIYDCGYEVIKHK